jgi:hypothetical protein
MGAVGIHPMAVDNSWQYRPQESPGNSQITYRAGDIFPDFVIVVNFKRALSYLPDDQGVLKAASTFFVAEEHSLNDPEDLTDVTRAQNGLYAH